MAIPHPKQHAIKPPPSPDEDQVKCANHVENSLFALLGAMSAIVTGLALYGDFRMPTQPHDSRGPASASSEQIEPAEADPACRLPYGY